MTNQGRPLPLAALAVAALLAATCGGDTTPTTFAADPELPPEDPAPTLAATPTTEGETVATPPAIQEDCGEPATEIAVGSVINDSVDMGETFTEDLFFCVQITEGAPSLTLELTGLSANLNLYVGYPDMEAVTQGGLAHWSSRNPDTTDEMVFIEPGFYRGDLGNFEQFPYLHPGPYYIEVSSPDGRGASPFTLSVSVP